MHLFDVATVIENGDHWPAENDSRDCGVLVVAGEVCDPPDETTLPTLTVINGQGDGDTYRFQPFSMIAKLSRRVWCSREDDGKWLSDQLKASTERAILLALVTSPYTDAETGFYNAGITVTGASVTAPAKLIALHEAWTDAGVSVEGEVPIVFVTVHDLDALYGAHLILNRATDNEMVTVWGDPVVLLPDSVAAGSIYISGPITVYLTAVESVDGPEIRGNREEYRAYREAAVDTAPCLLAAYSVTP